MPRPFGGHTSLGREVNKNVSKTDTQKSSIRRTKFGILHKSVDDTYNFLIKVLKRDGTVDKIVGPISLAEPPEDLAQRYGSPKEMENVFLVKIEYTGVHIDHGLAVIVKNFTGIKTAEDIDEVSKSNELQVKGTAFAPPGSGLV